MIYKLTLAAIVAAILAIGIYGAVTDCPSTAGQYVYCEDE